MRIAAYAAHREQEAKQAEQAGGRQGTGKAGTYQVDYQTVGHLLSGLPNGRHLSKCIIANC